MRLIFAVLPLLLVGCAANSGVVPMGADTFLVSRQAASGFSGLGTLKVDALREADDYCRTHKKQLQVVTATEAPPPYIFGNFPKAEVQFRCLDAETPEHARPQ